MPTYEYECSKCKRVFERSQKVTDKPLKKCPFDGCGGKVQRLISAGTSLIFKGSGFYETDYKEKETKRSPESKREPKTCPAAEGKSCESCPLAKSD